MSVRRDTKKKVYAPFGVAIKRFATIGFHPNLDPSGSLQKKGGLGPGQYDVNFQDCWYKTHCLQEPWALKKETEEFSKMLGYRNPHILKNRENAAKANGPGTRDIPPELFRQQSNNAKKNVFFGHEKRFFNLVKNKYPGPASYGKNHDPYTRIEEASKPMHQWTTVPIFEWDNFVNRFKLGRFEPKGTVPPNRYTNIFSVGIEQTLAKIVSKRGPYDLFTGPRDHTTIKGYFAAPMKAGGKNWPVKLPGEMERLKQKQHKHNGKFLKCARFTKNPGLRLMLTDLTMCPKNPDDPGPGHYSIAKVKPLKQNTSAFNQSVLHVRPSKKWEIHPGVGRYNIKPSKCKYKQNRESWFFKSKSKREFYHIETYNNF